MAASAYLQEVTITHLLRTGTWSKPTEVWVALFVGENEVSITDTGYARVQHGPSDTSWTESVGGVSRNLGTIQYGAPTVNNWGEITGLRLFSAATGGNEFARGNLDVPLLVNVGSPAPSFASEQVAFTVS